MVGSWLLKARIRARRIFGQPWRHLRPVEGAPANFGDDLWETAKRRDLLFALAHQRTISRFRQTILGPVWIVLSFVITTLGIALLWAQIMDRPLETYYPYITLGFFVWNFFQSVVTEGARALMENKNLALQTRTPMAMYPILTVVKQANIALYNLPYVLIVMAIYPPATDYSLLLVIPGMLLVLFTAAGGAIALSIWCAYVPDLAELIGAGMRFAFFLTPVIWLPFERENLSLVYLVNPLFHMLNVVRGVVLHADHIALSFAWMGGVAAVMWILATATYWSSAGAVSSRL